MAGMNLRTFFLELDKCFIDEQRQNAVLLVKDILGDVADRITCTDQLFGELFERGAIRETDLCLLKNILKTVRASDALELYEHFVSLLCSGTKEYTQHPAGKGTFIGRKELLKNLLKFFQGQNHDTPPCLFLSGFPGVGKTSIACRICDTLSSTAQVVFTDLRNITDVSTMIRSLIRKIDGFKQKYDQDTLDDLVKDFEKLGRKHIIVLDNVEDILNPTSDPKTITSFMNCVEKMCENGHRDYLKIIITSRFQNPLKTVAEKLRRKLKAHIEETRVVQMCFSDAAEFFKYESVNADLREGDPEILALLCGFCPLAMKLVAGRLKNKMVKPRDMIKLLERSEESPGMRKIDIIHDPEVEYYEDMKFCIQRALQFVTEDDRSLLLRLSVIPGSFSKDTAAAVGALEDPSETGLRLQILVYYNLVDVENPPQEKRTAAGQFEEPNRWRLHTLLKFFLEEKEKNTAEVEVLEEANGSFFRHYDKVVKTIAASLDTDYPKAMRDMESEKANIFHFFFLQHKVKTQPMDDIVTRTEVAYLLQLMADIPYRLEYFKHRAAKAKEDGIWRQYAEFRCWEALQYNDLGGNTEVATSILEDAYDQLRKLPLEEQNSVGGQLAYAHFYHIWGNICVNNRDYATGIVMLEKSVVIRQNICDKVLKRLDSALIKTLIDLGHAFYTWSEHCHPQKLLFLRLALKYQRMASELLSKNHCDAIALYMKMGACYHRLEDYEKAVDTYQRAIDLNDALHQLTVSAAATILKNMALSQHELRHFDDGFKNAKKAYEIMKKKEDLREPAGCLYLCGLLKMKMREYQEAEKYFKMQLELEEKLLSNGRPHSNDWQHLQKKLNELCTLTDPKWKHYSDRFQNAEKAYENATRSRKCWRNSDSFHSRTDSDSSQERTKIDEEECINPDTLENEHFRILSKDEVFSHKRTLTDCMVEDLLGIDVDSAENPSLPIHCLRSRTRSSSLLCVDDERSLSDQPRDFPQERNNTNLDTAKDTEYKWPDLFKVVQNSDICPEWKTLGRSLGLRNADLSAIEADNRLLKEQCYQMLTQWKQASGATATPEVLINTLIRENFTETADEVQKVCNACTSTSIRD